jgi:hypothetical protein
MSPRPYRHSSASMLPTSARPGRLDAMAQPEPSASSTSLAKSLVSELAFQGGAANRRTRSALGRPEQRSTRFRVGRPRPRPTPKIRTEDNHEQQRRGMKRPRFDAAPV